MICGVAKLPHFLNVYIRLEWVVAGAKNLYYPGNHEKQPDKGSNDQKIIVLPVETRKATWRGQQLEKKTCNTRGNKKSNQAWVVIGDEQVYYPGK